MTTAPSAVCKNCRCRTLADVVVERCAGSWSYGFGGAGGGNRLPGNAVGRTLRLGDGARLSYLGIPIRFAAPDHRSDISARLSLSVPPPYLMWAFISYLVSFALWSVLGLAGLWWGIRLVGSTTPKSHSYLVFDIFPDFRLGQLWGECAVEVLPCSAWPDVLALDARSLRGSPTGVQFAVQALFRDRCGTAVATALARGLARAFGIWFGAVLHWSYCAS